MRVLLFAKAPRAGFVNTRLEREVGAARALSVYRDIGARVAAAVSSEFPLTVWYDPPEAQSEMRAWLGDHEYLAHVRLLGYVRQAWILSGTGCRPVLRAKRRWSRY